MDFSSIYIIRQLWQLYASRTMHMSQNNTCPLVLPWLDDFPPHVCSLNPVFSRSYIFVFSKCEDKFSKGSSGSHQSIKIYCFSKTVYCQNRLAEYLVNVGWRHLVAKICHRFFCIIFCFPLTKAAERFILETKTTTMTTTTTTAAAADDDDDTFCCSFPFNKNLLNFRHSLCQPRYHC